MAFTYAGSMHGGAPIVRNLQISADCYVGQMIRADAGTSGLGGHVSPMAASAAGPDVTSSILGICTGIVTSATYSSTYSGNGATYDTTQAAQVANDPVGAAEIEVTMLAPGDMVKAPIAFTTVGTAPTVLTCTTGSADGLTFVSNALSQATIDDFSTVYCRTGANRGIYRVVTTGATATQTMTVAFPYDIAAGDTFVAVQLVLGKCHWDIGSQFQAWLGNAALSNYYEGYCHQLNLEEAGREFAVISIAAHHLWATR